MREKRIKYIAILVVMLLAVALVPNNFGASSAAFAEEAAEKQYTNALDDLQRDESFSMEYYPTAPNDYSLSLVQIAESNDNELFVYVYQPSGPAKDLRASYISLSTNPKEDIKPVIYKLKYINSNDTIYKYVVEGLTVSSSSTRYYAILELLRPFIDGIDQGSGSDNIINHVEFPVKRQYKFSVINGRLSQVVTDIETIEITEKWVGFCRYPDGFKFFTEGACDAHFVAFDTDKPIDKLLSADVYYKSQSFTGRFYSTSFDSEDYGESEEQIKHITGENVTYEGSGWWAGSYKWNRIETVEDFIKNEERNDVYHYDIIDKKIKTKLTNEALESNLQGKKWVLRFTETEYSEDHGISSSYYMVYSTVITDVSILRLEFWTDGNYYNLGVVDNMQSGDSKPDNEVEEKTTVNPDGLWDWLMKILSVLFLLLIIALLAPFIPSVLKFLWWLITLPFRAIASIIKKIKKEK